MINIPLNKLSKRFEGASPWLTIVCSSFVASLLLQGAGTFFYLGLVGSVLIVAVAVISPWLGLLALYPLLFGIRPTPASIGLQEGVFGLLIVIVFIGAIGKYIKNYNLLSLIRAYGFPLLLGCVLLLINLFAAYTNHVSLVDWIRGLIPFCFLLAFIPVAILLGHDQKRQFWFGCSVGAFIALMVGYVVTYYFIHFLWQPYWTINVDGEVLRVTQKIAANYPGSAIGPLIDRITMTLQRSTDASLPVGVVAGFAVAVLSRGVWSGLAGMSLSIISLIAVLTTFTRSMLLSALIAIGVFALLVVLCHREKFWKMLGLLTCMGMAALIFIIATGMGGIWFGRLGWLFESVTLLIERAYEFFQATISSLLPTQMPAQTNDPAPAQVPVPAQVPAPTQAPESTKVDENVSVRLEEYKIAWQMFLENPFFGKGFGAQHAMSWESSKDVYIHQSVGYVHNWIVYMLMVGGVTGFIAYATTFITPIFLRITSLKSEPALRTITRVIILTMAIYGLFFAVFRLIAFNLLIAAVWGYIYSQKMPAKPKEVNG